MTAGDLPSAIRMQRGQVPALSRTRAGSYHVCSRRFGHYLGINAKSSFEFPTIYDTIRSGRTDASSFSGIDFVRLCWVVFPVFMKLESDEGVLADYATNVDKIK